MLYRAVQQEEKGRDSGHLMLYFADTIWLTAHVLRR